MIKAMWGNPKLFNQAIEKNLLKKYSNEISSGKSYWKNYQEKINIDKFNSIKLFDRFSDHKYHDLLTLCEV